MGFIHGGGEWFVGLRWEVGLHVCGGGGAMQVVAKRGGGVFGKKIFSLSQTPPLFATISIACSDIANIMQIRGFS